MSLSRRETYTPAAAVRYASCREWECCRTLRAPTALAARLASPAVANRMGFLLADPNTLGHTPHLPSDTSTGPLAPLWKAQGASPGSRALLTKQAGQAEGHAQGLRLKRPATLWKGPPAVLSTVTTIWF